MRFRLTPRSMTLDDLELLLVRGFTEFRGILQLYETTTAKCIFSDTAVAHTLAVVLDRDCLSVS